MEKKTYLLNAKRKASYNLYQDLIITDNNASSTLKHYLYQVLVSKFAQYNFCSQKHINTRDKKSLPINYAQFLFTFKSGDYQSSLNILLNNMLKQYQINNHVITYNIAQIYNAIKQKRKAGFYLEIVLKEKPAFEDGILSYCKHLDDNQRTKQAIQIIKRNLGSTNKGSCNLQCFYLKLVTRQLNNLHQREILKAFHNKSINLIVAFNLGLYLKKTKHPRKAYEIYRKIQQILATYDNLGEFDTKILVMVRINMLKMCCQEFREKQEALKIASKLKDHIQVPIFFTNFEENHQRCVGKAEIRTVLSQRKVNMVGQSAWDKTQLLEQKSNNRKKLKFLLKKQKQINRFFSNTTVRSLNQLKSKIKASQILSQAKRNLYQQHEKVFHYQFQNKRNKLQGLIDQKQIDAIIQSNYPTIHQISHSNHPGIPDYEKNRKIKVSDKYIRQLTHLKINIQQSISQSRNQPKPVPQQDQIQSATDFKSKISIQNKKCNQIESKYKGQTKVQQQSNLKFYPDEAVSIGLKVIKQESTSFQQKERLLQQQSKKSQKHTKQVQNQAISQNILLKQQANQLAQMKILQKVSRELQKLQKNSNNKKSSDQFQVHRQSIELNLPNAEQLSGVTQNHHTSNTLINSSKQPKNQQSKQQQNQVFILQITPYDQTRKPYRQQQQIIAQQIKNQPDIIYKDCQNNAAENNFHSGLAQSEAKSFHVRGQNQLSINNIKNDSKINIQPKIDNDQNKIINGMKLQVPKRAYENKKSLKIMPDELKNVGDSHKQIKNVSDSQKQIKKDNKKEGRRSENINQPIRVLNSLTISNSATRQFKQSLKMIKINQSKNEFQQKINLDPNTQLSSSFLQKLHEGQALQKQKFVDLALQHFTRMYKQFKSDAQKYRILLHIANNFHAKKDYSSAQKTFLKCCQFGKAQAFVSLGMLQISLGKIAIGVENLQKANCIDRFNIDIETKLIYGYSLNTKTADQAYSLAHSVLKREPQSLQTLIMTANILQKKGKIKQALQIVKAIDKSQDSVDIKYYSGLLYLNDSNIVEAYRFFSEALRLQPNHVPSLIQIATILSEINSEQAIAILQKSLSIEPQNQLALARLGKIYEAVEKDYENAMETYKTGLKINQNYDSYLKIGDCFDKKGMFMQAYINYKQAANLKKTSQINIKLAVNYQKQKQYKKSYQAYQTALTLLQQEMNDSIDKKKCLIQCGKMALFIQQYQNCIVCLNCALQLQESEQVYTYLGDAYYGKMEYSESLFNYQKALQMSECQQQNWALLEKIAMCFDRKQQYLASKVIYEKIIEKNPENINCINNLANILLIIGNTNQAFYWFQAILTKNPTNIQKRLRIADIYATVGDWSKVQNHLLICYKQKDNDTRVLQKLLNLYKEKRDMKMVSKFQKKLLILRSHKKQKPHHS